MSGTESGEYREEGDHSVVERDRGNSEQVEELLVAKDGRKPTRALQA
jgi:hypothetical protein